MRVSCALVNTWHSVVRTSLSTVTFQDSASSGSHVVLIKLDHSCMSTDGSSIVDVAHIEPWSETQNDDITNGLALSKNAHWMFDEGLWPVDDNLRIIVNTKHFREHGPEVIRLNSYAGMAAFG